MDDGDGFGCADAGVDPYPLWTLSVVVDAPAPQSPPPFDGELFDELIGTGNLTLELVPPANMITCTANAHGVMNNIPTRAPNRPGAYGVPETPGTAAIDRSQWLPPGISNLSSAQQNAYINQYRNQISGYVPNGSAGNDQVFNGVSDNMGPASGVANLLQRYPGRVLFELPGGQDLGNVDGMQFQLPSAMGCPHP